MKTSLGSAAMVAAAIASAGCNGLLGLDDKLFDESAGGGGTGGATTTSSGGGGAGGATPTDPTGGGTTTTDTTGGGGAGGGTPDPLDDEFDFVGAGDQAANALAARGWLFTWREPTKEAYPEFGPPDNFPYPNLAVNNDQLVFGLQKTFYWVLQKKGVLMYKKIAGDFLVVADVLVSDGPTPGIPKDQQAGAGILVRDPASSSFATGGQNWISIDRSGKLGVSYVHASWGRGPAQDSKGEPAAQGGKIALCRTGDAFQVWSRDGGSGWVPRSNLLDTLPGDFQLPSEVQVGLFAYAYNRDEGAQVDLPSPAGVKGAFQYVRQYDAKQGCNPSLHDE